MRDDNKFRIISKYGSSSDREWALFVTGTNRLQMAFFDVLDRQVAIQSVSDFTSLENQEISVCGTYDGTNVFGGINLYVDGIAIPTADVSSGAYSGMVDTTTMVRIGRLEGFNSADGQLSDVRVMPVELSPAEVLTLHTTNVSPVDVAHWPLNGDADDVSGNGHDGVNVGGTFVPAA